MRRILFVLLACIVVLGAALWIAQLPGAARFEAGSLSVDASLPVLVFAALLALGIFYLLIRLLGVLIRLPGRLRIARALRRRRDGDAAVTRTLVALAAGHQSDATHHAMRARKMLGDTPQTLLLAAQASRLAGRDDEAADHFRTLAERADASLLGLRGLLRMAIAREDWPDADTLLLRAEAAHPNAPWLREERAKLAIRTGDWKSALALSGPAAPRSAYAAAAATTADDPAEALKLARAAWKTDPGFVPAALGYATRLRDAGSARKAVAVLQDAWNSNPHPDLGAAALAGVTGGAARLAAARTLTHTTADNPESQLLLARAALDANELGEARTAADRATSLNQRRAYALLAEIEQRIHPDSQAVRAAWQQAATAPDPSWRCTACGHRQAGWNAKCANCGMPGSLAWE